MKRLVYLLPVLLLVFSCNDPDVVVINNMPDDDGLPRVDKTITRAETFFDLTIVDQELYIETSDGEFEAADSTFTDFIVTNGSNSESNWDPDFGIITFSSEEPGSSPYPTVTILYDPTTGNTVSIEEASYSYIVTETGIALQDVLIGTAEELNARTYKYPYLFNQQVPKLLVIEVGNNYIRGGVTGQVVKRIFEQGKFTGKVVLANFVTNFRICSSC